MKIYVASKFNNQEKVKKVYEKLRERGHEITVDWTKHKKVNPYKNNPKMSEKYSKEDMNGVRDADVFVLLTTEKPGKGMFVELGTAVILNAMTGKPKIYVIGDHNTQPMFYFHPGVARVDRIEDVIKGIKK